MPNDIGGEEFREGGLKNRDHPKILRTRDLSNDIIEEVPTTSQIDTNPETSSNENCVLKTFPNLSSRNGINEENEINPIPAATSPVTLVEEVQKTVDFPSNEIPVGSSNLAVTEDDLAVIPLKGAFEEVKDIPPPHDLFDVITKQSQETITIPTTPVAEVLKSFPDDTPSSSVLESWLNNSLVPYEYTSKNGDQHRKLLISYPVSEEKPIVQPEVKSVGTCNCIAEKGYCDCGNCNRNPNVPFGKRFSADMDSLHRMIDLEMSPYSRLNGVINSGYSASLESKGSSLYEQNGNGFPTISVNGLRTSSGSGYYRDPSKEVIFTEPSIVELFKGSNSMPPEFSDKRIMKPHIYEVVPKYDIIPKDIPSLDIPDLVTTNKVLCSYPAPEQSYHKAVERPSLFCPVHGPIPHLSDRPSRTIIVNIPYENCPFCGNSGSFLDRIRDLKDIP